MSSARTPKYVTADDNKVPRLLEVLLLSVFFTLCLVCNMFNRNEPHPKGDYRKRGLVRSGVRALSGGVGLVSESFKTSGRSDSGTPSEPEPEPVSSETKATGTTLSSASEGLLEGNFTLLLLCWNSTLSASRLINTRCA